MNKAKTLYHQYTPIHPLKLYLHVQQDHILWVITLLAKVKTLISSDLNIKNMNRHHNFGESSTKFQREKYFFII
jgi:hypothetical protein